MRLMILLVPPTPVTQTELSLGLSTLIHLRELKVDGNQLTCLDGILQLDGLLKVSAKHNQISRLDFTSARLPRLEVLECQKNCISWIDAVERLVNLMSLHLGTPLPPLLPTYKADAGR